MSKYIIEPIGAEFSSRELARLAEHFNERAREGYRLHSVFLVTHRGCLGLGQSRQTYLAIYEKVESSDRV